MKQLCQFLTHAGLEIEVGEIFLLKLSIAYCGKW